MRHFYADKLLIESCIFLLLIPSSRKISSENILRAKKIERKNSREKNQRNYAINLDSGQGGQEQAKNRTKELFDKQCFYPGVNEEVKENNPDQPALKMSSPEGKLLVIPSIFASILEFINFSKFFFLIK